MFHSFQIRGASVAILLWAVLLAVGCAPQAAGPNGIKPGDNAEIAAQLGTLNERLSQFDADNRDLHTQVAQLQQMLQVSQEEKRLLKKQLADASTELESVQIARQETAQQLQAMQASNRGRGGATITANNSLKTRLQAIEIAGADVRMDGDVVRIELPADRLFTQGRPELQPSGMTLLEQAGQAIRQNYPRQIIGIEGHTDPMTGSRSVVTAHQLTATQSLSVFHHLSRTGTIPAQQMFTMGMGANRPRFSNGEAAGRARNRRIELVIYPEQIDGM